MDSLYSTMNQRIKGYHSKSGLLSKLVSKTASLLELLHVNLVVPRLPSAMKYCFSLSWQTEAVQG